MQIHRLIDIQHSLSSVFVSLQETQCYVSTLYIMINYPIRWVSVWYITMWVIISPTLRDVKVEAIFISNNTKRYTQRVVIDLIKFNLFISNRYTEMFQFRFVISERKKKECSAFRLPCGIGCCSETVSRAQYISYNY